MIHVRDLDLRIVTDHRPVSPAGQRQRRDGLITYEASAYLTPAHVDVTASPAVYARAKSFGFPSRRQLQAMDADRWVRQRAKAAKRVAVSELPPLHYSLDNRAKLGRGPRLDRMTVALIQHVLLNASRHLHFTRKTVR